MFEPGYADEMFLIILQSMKNPLSSDGSIKVRRLQFIAVILILYLKSDMSPVALYI